MYNKINQKSYKNIYVKFDLKIGSFFARSGEGNGKPLQYSCLENPMNSMKRQNDRILKEELPGSVGAQYAIGDQWRNNFRKNERMEPKQKTTPSCGYDW